MAGNTTDANILHQVHDAESNATTVTVRGGRYDTSTIDPVKAASAEVMKGRKISKPKGKSTAGPATTSAVPARMDSMANANQGTGLQFPTVPQSTQSTVPAVSSNSSEPREPAATLSYEKPATPARPSKLAAQMKEQQHETSLLGSLLDDIAKPTSTTYTVEGPSTKLGSLRNEINQPLVPTYAPQPLTSQSPSQQRDQPPRTCSAPDEISQPAAAAHSSHHPTSQCPPKQHGQPSRDGTRPDEINQPTAATHSSHPPTSLILPNTIDSLTANMADSSTMGSPEADGDHSPPEASKPAQNQGPTVTRNKEGKPTLKLGPKAQFPPDQQQQQRSTIGSVPDEISNPTATPYSPTPPTSQSHPKQVETTSSELVISSASITENQDVTPVLPSTAGVIRQNVPLVVPQPFQQPASPVITPPLPLAASVNSNIPLFHPSMLPNPNKHFTTTQTPASSGSYGYSSQISTERSVTPYSPSTAMGTKQTNDEGQVKPYPDPSAASGNHLSGASFRTHTSPLFGQALQPAISNALPSARPSMSDILRDSPTNPNWKPATQAFAPSVPHTPWPLQTTMDYNEGELLQAPDTIPSISVDPEPTITADSDEMEDLKPAVAAIIPQPVYRPTVNNEMADMEPEVSSVVAGPVQNLIMNNEMEDLKPEATSVVPEPMYRPTVDNELELDDLDAVSESAQSPSISQYNQKEEVLTYNADATPHTPPVAASQLEDIASTEVEPKEEVSDITKDEPSRSEEAGDAPKCSDTLEIKHCDLDPKYIEYRNKEARKSRPFHWDLEDNRDPRSEYDCTDEEMQDIIKKLEQLKLRVIEFPTSALKNEAQVIDCSSTTLDEIRVAESPITTLDNESRVIESATQAPEKESRVIDCPTAALNNESQVIDCSTTAAGNEVDQSQFCPQRTAPTSSIEEPVLPDSSNGNVPKQDGTIRDLCVVEPTFADDPLVKNVREGESTTSNSQATVQKQSFKIEQSTIQKQSFNVEQSTIQKQSFKIEQLEKKVKELNETRITVWRRTVEEAAAKRTKKSEIELAEKLAELDHKESSLRDERKQFETDCTEMEEDLKSREQKLASNEREYARRLRDLETREAQVAESGKQLELQQEEQNERDEAVASRLKEAQEELEKLKEEKKQGEDDANLRLKKVQEELELQQEEQKKRDKAAASRLKKAQEELERLKEEKKQCEDDANLRFKKVQEELETLRNEKEPAKISSDSDQIPPVEVSEDPQQIEQNSMFSSTWKIEERVANIPGTGSHFKWMLPLLMVLVLLFSTKHKLIQQPVPPRQDVILRPLPETCSFAERPATFSSSISPPDLLCLADYSNNYSEASSFLVSGLIDLANDVQPFGERVVGIDSVSHTKTSPSTLAIFKTWFWNFVLTGTAHGRVGVVAGRRELYH